MRQAKCNIVISGRTRSYSITNAKNKTSLRLKISLVRQFRSLRYPNILLLTF